MKRIIEKIVHMFRVKDCCSICLFCKYYDICSKEAGGKEP